MLPETKKHFLGAGRGAQGPCQEDGELPRAGWLHQGLLSPMAVGALQCGDVSIA